MPELPEIEALRIRLGPELVGETVTDAEVNQRKAHVLRYPVDDFQRDLPVHEIRDVARRGKHLVLTLALPHEGRTTYLVINPMLSGRFQLGSGDEPRPPQWVFALRLASRRELRYLDHRDMGRVYLTADPDRDVPAWRSLGPEADSIEDEGFEWFRQRLRRHRDELKDLLRNQSFLAGIGNAYSDEILFDARLLPLRRRASLSVEEERTLYESIPRVLRKAIEAIVRDPNYDESKQNRSFMNVHGKGGKDCPRCGHRISQLGSDREPLNFCRGCQL